MAPLGPLVWGDRRAGIEKMNSWRIDWKPGCRYIYHSTSAHWVLAELIERVTGHDYRDEVFVRILEPLELPRLLGIKEDDQQDIVNLVGVGEEATGDEMEEVFGIREIPDNGVTENLLMNFNHPETRAAGVPGGGGFGRARDLALFYQALLHNTDGIWDAGILADAVSLVRNKSSPVKLVSKSKPYHGQSGGNGYSQLIEFINQ